MRILGIDIETFSEVNLQKCGVYAYSNSSTFKILLFAYAYDEEPVQIIDLANGEELPPNIVRDLRENNVIKTAFNAQFERACLSKHLNSNLSAESWRCTEIQGAIMGLPLSLGGVSQVLKLPDKKIEEGRELIRYFCIPCEKGCKVNQGEEEKVSLGIKDNRNLPKDNVEKWNRFKEYCIRDLEVEREIRKHLENYPITNNEHKFYMIDQEINDRGIKIDWDFVNKAIQCDTLYRNKVISRMSNITKLSNVNSVEQIKTWLKKRGIEVDSLNRKEALRLREESCNEVKEVIDLRLQLGKSSIKKYESIERCMGGDHRIRGLFQFYGANRTGRWAGRLVQVQNLPQNHMNLKDLELARNLIKSGKFSMVEMLFESTSQVLSELIRTAFIPKKNHRFIVADFSAIEARVIAWLAGETWRMNVFKTHGKIYEASASKMFGVPVEEITKTSSLRQKGKIAELALGYGGSTGALCSMGAKSMGIEEKELIDIVKAWRAANPNIVRLWRKIGNGALRVLRDRVPVTIGRIKIQYKKGLLLIKLPSGRRLSYIRPRISMNKYGTYGITYDGCSSTKKWERIETYGPKLVENIVQGIARDLLGEAMINITNEGYKIVMHVHDEVVIECDSEEKIGPRDIIQEICNIMCRVPKWAEGLELRAEGYQCEYYRKE